MSVARCVRVFVAVMMVMFGGGIVVTADDGMLVEVLMCNVDGRCCAMMNRGFSRQYGLGGERSYSEHKGQERYEGIPPFPTICPQPQHFLVTNFRRRLSFYRFINRVAHK